jgi:hypothetical protein
MPFLQDIIHKIEVGGGPRYIRYALAFLAIAALLMVYNLRVVKNFGTQEAMDTAQLARNISEGKGYTTSFIRPFSLHLVSERNRENPSASASGVHDLARIKRAHPDIANPPVYPVVLAGVMKVLPFEFNASKTVPFWSQKGRFWRYQPDFLISWFNQALFLVVIFLTYFWAKRMFDMPIAATAAILLFGSEILWRFSSSGLSTMLLMLILVGMVWMMTLLQTELAEPKRGALFLPLVAAGVGVLVGAGALTRYGFGWLIIPAVLMVTLFGGPKRVHLSLLMFGAFAVVLVPWIFRNWNVSGTLFGTATYDLFRGASIFPDHRLDRSLSPEIQPSVRAIWMKLLINARLILQNEFFSFGGGWIIALFLVGLMVGFRSPVIRRMRYFVTGSLGLFFVVQAMGRTQLSEDSPGINSENLLILLVPFIVVYAVSFFYLLLDQIQLPAKQLRYAVVALLALLAYLPLGFALLPPKGIPVNYPPYYPPMIQHTGELFREHELMMSDVPWAMAWYGRRQCVWLTLEATTDANDPGGDESFFAINDLLKPIYGVYLTPNTMNFRYQADIVSSGSRSWAGLVLSTMLIKDAQGQMAVPKAFPLRKVAPGYLPEQMLFTDWERWSQSN